MKCSFESNTVICVRLFSFRKEDRDQIANIHWIIDKTREFQKNICFWFIDFTKTECVDHNKLWKILRRWKY